MKAGEDPASCRRSLALGPLHILVKAKSGLQRLERTRGGACPLRGLEFRQALGAKPWTR